MEENSPYGLFWKGERMTTLGFFLYFATEGFVRKVEDHLISGWNNNSFIAKHMDESSPEIQTLVENFDGLYYQWDMGIQCKYEAGVWNHGNVMRFWTTYESAKNVAFFRLYFREKGPITITSSEVMSYWDGWEENAFKKYASFTLFEDETPPTNPCHAIAFTKDMKMVPLNFSRRYRH